MPWGAVAGAAIGAVSAYNNKPKGSSQSQTSSEPWGAQQPYLQDIFQRAQGLSGGSTVGQQSPYTQQAIQRLAGTAAPGSITNQSLGEWGKTINGDYLSADSNPYLKGAVDKALGEVQGRVNSQFGVHGGNNFGSSGHQEWLGRNLAETALPIYAQNYQQERGRQLNAAQLGPTMDTAGVAGLQQAGGITDAYQQALVDSPWNALQRYQGLVTGNYGGQGTANTPYFGSSAALGALGGGMAGMGIYSQGKQAGLWGAGNANPASYDSQGNFAPTYSGYDFGGGGSAYG
jgi:hypothetical protein